MKHGRKPKEDRFAKERKEVRKRGKKKKQKLSKHEKNLAVLKAVHEKKHGIENESKTDMELLNIKKGKYHYKKIKEIITDKKTGIEFERIMETDF